MRQKEEEFQFFKAHKKAEKSTAYILVVPLLAFITNLLLTLSIISYFNHPQAIDNGIQIKIVHLNQQQNNQVYGTDYNKLYQHMKQQYEQNTIVDNSQKNIATKDNKNMEKQTFTPEEIAQINRYFKP